MKKLCLLKFSALGDLAQIEPFLPSLAKEYKITLFTSRLGYEYYKTSPYIADFIVLKSKKCIIFSLPFQNFGINLIIL